MSANRTSTIEARRKPTGAFFRWETPGEPIAVHFQLNIVDLLERDLIRSEGIYLVGVLLGRIENGRKGTLIVEDYESISNLARLDTSDPALGDRPLLGKLIDHWHSKPEKRISILGFYRNCPYGQASLNNDDLKISSAYSTDLEQIFLLIEPQMAKESRATLYMVRGGAVAWKWHSVSFNRKQLAEKGAAFQSPISGLQGSSQQSQEVLIPENQDSGQRPEKHVKASYKLVLALGIVATLITIATGILPLRSKQLFRALTDTIKAPDEPSTLALKLQRVGNDWQLNWDPTAPFLLKAAAGHLLITDGFIHKSVDLDISDLRSGNIMYTPITEDVSIRLDAVSAESVTLSSGTARLVAGLLLSPPSQSTGGSRHSSGHPKKVTSLASLPAPSIKDNARESLSAGSSSKGLLPAKATIPLTMSPPVNAIGHESPNLEAAVALPNPGMVLPETFAFAVSSLSPAPPVSDQNVSGSNLNSSFSATTVLQSAEAERSGIDSPAELITRRDPVYPELAKRSGVTGVVQLQFRVSVSGKIEKIRVVKGPPVLVQAALEAVQRWRYNPAQVKGTPVESDATTTIVFKLD
jgi:TonB family protein